MRSSVVTVIAAVVLTSCGASPPPVEEEKEVAVGPPRFEGLIVAGSPADARASGFTECVTEGNGYYGFTCAKPDAVILGVKPARAVVRLTYPSDLAYDAPRLPEQTTYSSITYQFPEATGSDYQGCAYDSANPYRCITDQSQPLPALIQALGAHDWIGRGTRWGADYVKPHEPFKVSISTRAVHTGSDSRSPLVVEVNVYPASSEEVAELVEINAADQRNPASRVAGNESFVEGMKGP